MYYACSYDDCPNHGIEREVLEDAGALAPSDQRRLCYCGRAMDRLAPGAPPEHVPMERPEPLTDELVPLGEPTPDAATANLQAAVAAVVGAADFEEAKANLQALLEENG